MAYGRIAKQLGGSVLRASPLGALAGPASLAKGLAGKIPGLSSLFGGMGKRERRLRAKGRVAKFEKIIAGGGALTPLQLQRLGKMSKHKGWKNISARARALSSRVSQSGTVGAGPMSLAMTPVRRTAKARKRWTRRATATARRITRSTRKRSSGRNRRRMPAGLARYWAERRKKKRAARTLARG